MLYDSSVDKRHPLTDKVGSYFWFPNRNYLMTISEKRKFKNIDTTINFFEIPSRKQCSISIPFTNIQITAHRWHPNGKILLLLLKSVSTPEWSIRIIDFNFVNFTHKSKSYDIIKPVVRSVSFEESMTDKDIDYCHADIEWMDNGTEIMVAAKKRLLIPTFSSTEKKYVISDNGSSMSIFMYSFSVKDIKATAWPEDKEKNRLNLRYDSIVVSPTYKNFICFNKRYDDSSSYGEGLLFAVDEGVMHIITRLSFSDKFSNIKFDQSGRFYAVELSRMYMGITLSSGFRISNISGELVSEIKDDSLREVFF